MTAYKAKQPKILASKFVQRFGKTSEKFILNVPEHCSNKGKMGAPFTPIKPQTLKFEHTNACLKGHKGQKLEKKTAMTAH